MPKLTVFPLALIGGLQDSKAIPDPSDLQSLSNFTIFRGRFALRAPFTETVQLLDDQGTPAAITSVLAGRFHKNKFYVLGHSTVTNKTYLYRLDPDATSEGGGATTGPVVTVWTGAAVPQPMMVSFDGGSAAAPVSRLFIADYSEQYDTMFWNSDASTINNVQEDFDDSGVKENLRFNLIWSYQFHMWGAGFLQAGASRRPEMARFSQPGLIPATEPNVVNNASREWWSVDFRPIGRRGSKLVAAADGGGAKILLKRTEVYALFGYDSESWAVRQLSDKIGAVGPYAATTTENGLCLFWSDSGPHMTDGQQVVDIGEDIRKHVQETPFSALISADYSPDDNLVYFGVPAPGSTVPDKYLAYDPYRKLWTEGQWLAASAARVSSVSAGPDEVLPGPLGPPSGLTATAVSDTQINLAWTNGDLALDTKTRVHRGTVAAFVVSDANQIAELASGVASYQNTTGLSQITTFYYKVRHIRNGILSANSNEANAKTWLAEPTGLDAQGLVNGVRVVFTNNAANADIEIERKPSGGAYTLLTTLLNQTTGSKTHDDTTATCGTTYFYRARAKKTGEPTSEFSNEDSQTACGQVPDITSVDAFGCSTAGVFDINVQWTGTGFETGDTAKVYRNLDGAGFTFLDEIALTLLLYTDVFGGFGDHTIQYRVEAWENGTTLRDTFDSTTKTHGNC